MSVFNSLGSNYKAKHLGAMLVGFNPMAKNGLLGLMSDRYNAETILTYKGREAIYLALSKQEFAPGSAVAINGYTCFAVYDAVVSAGLVPVYVDIKKGELNYSAKQLESAVKQHPDITAVIVQNTLGTPADMAAIEKLCTKKKLYLLEDLAHSIGMFYEDGREAGTVADAALSFSQDKVVDGVSGGAFLYREESEFSPKMKRLGYFTFLKDYYYIFNTMFIRSGYTWGGGKVYNWILRKVHFLPRPMSGSASNVKHPDIWHINLIYSQFKDLEDTIEHRQSIADIYRENLPKKVQLTHFKRATDLRFPLQVEDPKSLIKFLKRSGIFVSDTWYESPVSPAKSISETNYEMGMCPNSEAAAAQMVNLPTHVNVDAKTAELITEKVNKWLTQQQK